MKKLRLLPGFIWLLFLIGLSAAHAQVVTTQPAIFRDTDQVTIIFDANQGNRGMASYTGPVYIYTGVLTNLSTGPGNWRYVKNSNFGQPTAAELMTPLGNNRYSITFTPRTYYNVPASEQILRLAMVFRGTGGTPEGKDVGNADIFVNVSQGDFTARITSPTNPGTPIFVSSGTSISVKGEASVASTLQFTLNKTQIAQQANATSLTTNVTINQTGRNVVRFTATNGSNTASDSLIYYVAPNPNVAALPAGAKEGVTYLNGGTSVILNLTAPNKQFVYAIGEWNSWLPTTAGLLNRTPDGTRWWVQIDGLTPGREYAYQYLVDGQLRIADPYTEKILSPTDDQFIPAVTYPNLKPYPTGQTTGNVSVLQTNQPSYNWQVTNFQRPKRSDLVIYELLLRDFVARHDYQTLRDTLSYLQRLGVNAIELLPFNEFEGNESWGYNPSFYFAPDKYYGTKDDLKRFIDECHRRGIAVIMDMVLNHSCGQSPMVQLYFNGAAGKPAANSPWYNVDATHPYNVCYDFNHESAYTKSFSKNVMSFWLQEYKIDGYRFDLAGGFTQNISTDDESYAAYDQSRINIWKEYYDHMRSVDATAYPILEIFSDNAESLALTDYGMMIWGNMNHSYNEATMGYLGGSDFSSGYFATRGLRQPNLITYMESHDEERLTFKNVSFGNSSGSYNVKDLNTALARDEMAAAFFFTVPGPKMVWQFGELGYDFSINRCPDGSINNDCRTANKPIRWDYQQVPARKQLYEVYRSLMALKINESVFENPTTYTQQLTGAGKTIHLSDPSLSVTVVGNFDVVPTSVNPAFQQAGTWYNYLTGATRTVTDPNAAITLQPGEYAVYTSRRITRPGVLATKSAQKNTLRFSASPNPVNTTATLHYELTTAAPVSVTVTNLLGATVRTLPTTARQTIGAHELTLSTTDLANGVYLVRLSTGQQQQTARLLVKH